MVKIYFILLMTYLFTSCISIKKNNLTEKQVALEKEIELSFSFYMNTKENGQTIAEYQLNYEIINFNNENCTEGDWKINHSITIREIAAGARNACEIQLFLSEIPKIKKVKLVSQKSQEKYHLDIKHKSNVQMIPFLGYLTVGTLFIIPSSASVKFNWEVTLYKNGIKVKKYDYEDEFDVWHSIFLLPFTPFVDGYSKSSSRLHKHFINNLVYDLSKDGYLN